MYKQEKSTLTSHEKFTSNNFQKPEKWGTKNCRGVYGRKGYRKQETKTAKTSYHKVTKQGNKNKLNMLPKRNNTGNMHKRKQLSKGNKTSNKNSCRMLPKGNKHDV